MNEDGSVYLHSVTKRVSEVYGAFASKGRGRKSPARIREDLREAFKEGKL